MADDLRKASNPQRTVNTTPIWWSLTNFSYNPASVESWIRLGCQVAVVGGAIVLLQALDGRTCGQGWALWFPQTWGRPAGCFVRSLIQNVPDDFMGTPTAPVDVNDDVVAPPPPQQP